MPVEFSISGSFRLAGGTRLAVLTCMYLVTPRCFLGMQYLHAENDEVEI